jgi:hypothetical protein
MRFFDRVRLVCLVGEFNRAMSGLRRKRATDNPPTLQ